MNLDYVDKLLDINKYYLYYKHKAILSANSQKELEKEVKKNIDSPTKDIKVFVVDFGKTKNENKQLVINCVGFTITKKLNLVNKLDDVGQSVTYSKSYLEKKKFKLSDILKIIKAIENDKMSFENSSVPISEVGK
jgi:GTPase Era involved in 16S rRNA processing